MIEDCQIPSGNEEDVFDKMMDNKMIGNIYF